MTDEELIDAAEVRAGLYDNDDRQDIKTDVLNAFYAGAKFGHSKAREAERKACAFVRGEFRREI